VFKLATYVSAAVRSELDKHPPVYLPVGVKVAVLKSGTLIQYLSALVAPTVSVSDEVQVVYPLQLVPPVYNTHLSPVQATRVFNEL